MRILQAACVAALAGVISTAGASEPDPHEERIEAMRAEMERRDALLRDPAALRIELAKGLDPNDCLLGSWSMMHDAARGEGVPLESLQAVLAAGADPNVRGIRAETPLMLAALRGGASRVRALLSAGADVARVDQRGLTALHHAVQSLTPDSAEVPQALLEAGADPNAKDVNGATPMHWAALNGRSPAGRWFASNGWHGRGDLAARDARGRTPLMYAVTSGDMRTRMEADGGDPKYSAFYGIMSIVMQSDAALMVEILAGTSTRVNLADADGNTALMLAAGVGDMAALAESVGWSAEEALKLRPRGEGPMVAARSQQVAITELLLWKGADTSLKNKKGETALDIAARRLDRDRDRLVRTLEDAAKEPLSASLPPP